MSRRAIQNLGLAILWLVPGAAMAQHSGGGGFSTGGGSLPLSTLPIQSMPLGPLDGAPTAPLTRGVPLGAVAGGYAGYYYGGPYVVATPGYAIMYNPSLVAMGPAGYFVPIGAPPPMPVRGPLLPPPPPDIRQPAAPALRQAHGDPDRAQHYLTFGDRLFRAGNLKRAEQRYAQARDAAPDRAAPISGWRRSRWSAAGSPRRPTASATPRPPSPAGS